MSNKCKRVALSLLEKQYLDDRNIIVEKISEDGVVVKLPIVNKDYKATAWTWEELEKEVEEYYKNKKVIFIVGGRSMDKTARMEEISKILHQEKNDALDAFLYAMNQSLEPKISDKVVDEQIKFYERIFGKSKSITPKFSRNQKVYMKNGNKVCTGKITDIMVRYMFESDDGEVKGSIYGVGEERLNAYEPVCKKFSRGDKVLYEGKSHTVKYSYHTGHITIVDCYGHDLLVHQDEVKKEPVKVCLTKAEIEKKLNLEEGSLKVI